MAQPTDAAFGAGFDAAAFRSAIRSTMQMGAANNAPDRATFRWNPLKAYNPEDPAKNPYDWTETPTSNIEHADVQVPVAVEFTARPGSSAETVLGEFDASRAIVTVLDVDYALVDTANQVLLGQDVYDIAFVAPPVGLFTVTVYSVYCVAEDES